MCGVDPESQDMNVMGKWSEVGRAGVPRVRRSGLKPRARVRGFWDSTPAQSCSQKWGSLAAGRTRRSGGGAGAVRAGPWDRLEPGGILQGRSSGVQSRRLGRGPPAGRAQGGPALRVGESGLPVFVSRAPSLTWFPHQAGLRLSPAIPPGPASPAPPGAGLVSCPRIIATPRPMGRAERGAGRENRWVGPRTLSLHNAAERA